MCIQCHSRLSDEEVTKQMKENPCFENWNTSSYSHYKLSAMGVNGPEARNLALFHLKSFIEWIKCKPEGYFPKTGLEPFPKISKLESEISEIESMTIEEIEKIRHKFSNVKDMSDFQDQFISVKSPSKSCVIC